jgi:4-aminobutyrate aminotransferase
MTLAKGLGAIGIPSAAVLMEKKLDVLEPYEHSFTSGGNILALVAARATMNLLRDGRLLQHVRDHGPILGDLLRALQLGDAGISDVRGVGYMWGIELSKADGSPDVERTNMVIADAARNEHLILRSSRYGFGNVVKIRPSLIATATDLEEITTRLGRVLATTK